MAHNGATKTSRLRGKPNEQQREGGVAACQRIDFMGSEHLTSRESQSNW